MASFAGSSTVTISAQLQYIAGRSLLNMFVLFGVLLLALCSCTAAASSQRPKKLDFFMYIAVQNNTFLDNPKGQYTAVQTGTALKPQANAFGTIHTFDNPLTRTATLNDPKGFLGRVQGWYGNCGQDVLTLFLVQTFTYADDKYNGTFSLLGVDIASDYLKYAPIVGGTGDFAFARGVAVQRLLSTANVNSEIVSWFHYSIRFKY